jgi:hypothetical protein
MMTGDIPMGHNLPTCHFDGGDYSDRLIKGALLKNVDGRWSAKDGTILRDGDELLGLGTTEALQCWQDGTVSKLILKPPGKPLPDVDELNAQIPREDWEKGLDGNPRPPWEHLRIAYLLRIADAMMFTYLNSTTGARIAVQRLASQVSNMRVLRGAGLVPIIKLSSKPMKTQFGEKRRPDFEVVAWRQIGGGEIDGGGDPTPHIEPPKKGGSAEQIGRSVEPVTLKEEMNDEIGF